MILTESSSFLVVSAHPDDEVLGFGASAYRLTQAGHTVSSCIVVGNAEARQGRPGDAVDPECGAHGNVLDLWAAVRGLSLRQAGLDLMDTFHLSPTPESEQTEKRNPLEKNPLTQRQAQPARVPKPR